MSEYVKIEADVQAMNQKSAGAIPSTDPSKKGAVSKPKAKLSDRDEQDESGSVKRRCVSTACIACRKRKSKCDGQTPSCAACSSVYGTHCVYDPNSDHRRKGVYKKDIYDLKTRNSTLQTLIQAILNYPEEDVVDLVRQIRTCESLDEMAENIVAREKGELVETPDTISPLPDGLDSVSPFEAQLSNRMGSLQLDDGSVRYIGGTSSLVFLDQDDPAMDPTANPTTAVPSATPEVHPVTSWTEANTDAEFIYHLVNMYFTWHYPYFATLSKELFLRDFRLGKQSDARLSKSNHTYCSSLLVNAILALGCHFSASPAARLDPDDPTTVGDHFFNEAKRLIKDNDEGEQASLPTVQALGLMSVREAGCGRETKGWIYSGMSFRLANEMGLNLDSGSLATGGGSSLDEYDVDARRITFWGCYLFDKCWSNYLGRMPQLLLRNITQPKFDVFPTEDAETWSPYTDMGMGTTNRQPSRTRALALQISSLCEISSDILSFFYDPARMDKPVGKQVELKKLSELHTRLESWRRELPLELDSKEGTLPTTLLMHMFFHLLYIHLFRPFLRYTKATSPLPAHVSPRRLCTQAATQISKLLRLYKKSYGMRQICNIAVYMAHIACTIHILNLPDKTAQRDIIHGLKHLEEIAEAWLGARRTLHILAVLVKRWTIELPAEAEAVFRRTEYKFKQLHSSAAESPHRHPRVIPAHRTTSDSATETFTRHVHPNQQLNHNNHNAYSSIPQLHHSQTNPLYMSQSTDNILDSHPRVQSYQHDAYGPMTGTNYTDHSLASLTPSSNSHLSSPTHPADHAPHYDDTHRWYLRDQAEFATDFSNWNHSDGELYEQEPVLTGYLPPTNGRIGHSQTSPQGGGVSTFSDWA